MLVFLFLLSCYEYSITYAIVFVINKSRFYLRKERDPQNVYIFAHGYWYRKVFNLRIGSFFQYATELVK